MRRSVAALIGIVLIGGCIETSEPGNSARSGSRLEAPSAPSETETVVLSVPGMT